MLRHAVVVLPTECKTRWSFLRATLPSYPFPARTCSHAVHAVLALSQRAANPLCAPAPGAAACRCEPAGPGPRAIAGPT